MSILITAYPLGWEENHFYLVTLKLVPRSHFLITSHHTLSSRLETKPFSFCNFRITSPAPDFFTSYHTLSLQTTPYPLGWKQNHFHLATLKLVPRPQFFVTSYHTLSILITPYHILSPRLETKPFLFGDFKINSPGYVFVTFCFRYRK